MSEATTLLCIPPTNLRACFQHFHSTTGSRITFVIQVSGKIVTHGTVNSTMNSAPASDAPFNMSDYVNFDFDFDFEAPHQAVNSISTASVAEPFQSLSIDNLNLGLSEAADIEFPRLSNFSDGSSAVFDGFHIALAASVDLGNLGALQASIPRPTLIDGMHILELDPEKSGMSDAFPSRKDANAGFDDFIAPNYNSETSPMTDAFRTITETDPSPDDLAVFGPTTFARGIDPTPLEVRRSQSIRVSNPTQDRVNSQSHLSPQTVREPSRWVPASPQMQQYLNMLYAPQLVQPYTNPNPTPALYSPAQQKIRPSPPGSLISLANIPTQYGSPPTMQPRFEISSIDPSLLMRENEGLPPQQPLSNGRHHPISPISDDIAPKAQDPESGPTRKRPLEAKGSDSGPGSKRAKAIEVDILPIGAEKDDADDDDEPGLIRRRAKWPRSIPIAAKGHASEEESKHGSEDDPEDEAYDSNSPGFSSAPRSPILPLTPVVRKGPSPPLPSSLVVKHGSNRRYEQQREPRVRDQQGKVWNRRRASKGSTKGKVPYRKMQKLLKEIEDTKEFAEAQGYEVDKSVEKDSPPQRPVRKGARKSYVGLE